LPALSDVGDQSLLEREHVRRREAGATDVRARVVVLQAHGTVRCEPTIRELLQALDVGQPLDVNREDRYTARGPHAGTLGCASQSATRRARLAVTLALLS